MDELSDEEFECRLRERYPLISPADQALWRVYELDPGGLDRRKARANTQTWLEREAQVQGGQVMASSGKVQHG